MKIALNKKTLSEMPEQVRSIVVEWKERHHKRHISVDNVKSFYASEDARVTLIDLRSGVSSSAQAAGEFAGMTKLSPTSAIPLPVGVVAVERGFFQGVPFLTVYQGCPTQLS